MTEDLERDIAGCLEATRRLLGTLDQLDDATAARPSRLPGWSVGHVLTHIARNADSHVRILRGAAEGKELRQYEGGAEQRSRDIDEGAPRDATALAVDVRTSAASLEEAFRWAPADVWGRGGLHADGSLFPCRLVPISRWREVEVHHADLGLGYEVTDWPEDFVLSDLPHALSRLPSRIADPGQRAAFLAWVYGRGPQPAEMELRPF